MLHILEKDVILFLFFWNCPPQHVSSFKKFFNLIGRLCTQIDQSAYRAPNLLSCTKNTSIAWNLTTCKTSVPVGGFSPVH